MHSNIHSIENMNKISTEQKTFGIKAVVVSVLLLWFGLVTFLAGRGDFTGAPGNPPLAILLSAVVPVVVFLAAYRLFESFRHFVLTFDLRLAAGIQAWRFAGIGFIALYANGVLPGSFAWPAGLGDMAVGMTAPWIMLALIRRPEFIRSKWFLMWNLFGTLDLVTAIGFGGLSAMLSHGTPGEITTGPMARLPLALIPAYFVPILFMLHLTALFQRRRAASGNKELA